MTWLNRTHFGDCRDSMRKMIAAGVRVNCIVTSPPYWNLRNYGHPCQLGLEKTPEEYIANMVEVFRLARDLLADDGVLWLNLGDSYLDKSLCMIPSRVSMALQDDGWYLRSMLPWIKRNCMPESIEDRPATAIEYIFMLTKSRRNFYDHQAVRRVATASSEARWNQDIANQRGSDRANGGGKTNGRMKAVGGGHDKQRGHSRRHAGFNERWDHMSKTEQSANGRNYRNSDPFFDSLRGLIADEQGDPLVLLVNPQPYTGAHFAVFPPALVEPFVLAGTSAHGHCSKCGAGWERITEKGAPDLVQQQACGGDANGEYHGKAVKEYAGTGAQNASATKARILEGMRECVTTGWKPTCGCGVEPVRGIVFDPFGGSGTTAQVAQQFGRDWILCELNEDYAQLQQDRTRQMGMAI